jgi:hypothetical protein
VRAIYHEEVEYILGRELKGPVPGEGGKKKNSI